MSAEERLRDYNKEQYSKYLCDIELANNAMSELLLNVPENELICDIYAIPSHNHQAFYAKMYEKDGQYKLLYAKPILYDLQYGEEIFMYLFKDSVQAGDLRGKIVCGIKALEQDFVNSLLAKLENLPDKYILGSASFIMDGVFHAIRVFEGDTVKKEVVYNDAADIPFEGCADLTELKWFYSEMYLMIEQIIGRG